MLTKLNEKVQKKDELQVQKQDQEKDLKIKTLENQGLINIW